ncbi:hypothetical protein [Aquabacterium sp.]|uniref:hypothetical protein n=1 Tax=Aquabacterium sp. TaxID=1872578 RepID=UPI0019BC6AE3|nr:hypothetical protein [Aquabacterium sp.]MBC7701683.1 hypothetical protein [Aquabacterium sp.]
MCTHGDAELYASGDTDQALDRWAKRMAAWPKGDQPEDAPLVEKDHVAAKRTHRDMHCEFDNDLKVKAPVDA